MLYHYHLSVRALMNLKLVSKKMPTREEIFVEKFPKIQAWAMQLAEREEDVADDLVQDAFVQFTLNAPDLKEINNLDGYLYGVLRNLRLSQIRRDARQRLTQLSVIEYDSASDGLQTVDWRDQFQAQDELRRVCGFLCARKDTARMASILILRFFHAYFPGEISQVLLTKRAAVDVRLLMARKEVKAFLDDPSGVTFVNLEIEKENFKTKTAAASDEFLYELRRLIFNSRGGDCLAEDFLDEFYAAETGAPLDTAPLAHLVSCANCLEKVNEMLNLPKLNERFPDDAFGRDKKNSNDSDGKGGSSGSSGGDVISLLRHKARRTLEHKPNELRVVVNGVEQGSLRVGGEINELNLNVNLTEANNFVEIFSEQNLRLLMLNVEEPPPAGKAEISARTIFSDRRNLHAELRFNAHGAALQVIYEDPTFREIENLLENPALLDEIERTFQPPPVKTGRQTPTKTRQTPAVTNFSRRFADFFGFNFQFSNRRLAFASIAAILVVGFAALQFLPSRQASAAERILQASETASREFDGVIYRRIKRTVVSPDFTRSLELEKWRDAKNDLLVTRSYRENGEILSEAHYSPGGRKLFFAPSTKFTKLTTSENITPVEIVKTIGNFWDRDLEAKTFREFVGDVENMKVEETPDVFIIRYDKQKERLIAASITIRKSDLRPVEQNYVLTFDGKTISMTITELKMEKISREELDLNNFPPAPGLVEKSLK
jgi:RNA polymerase sigma factor (sigma-70 family)